VAATVAPTACALQTCCWCIWRGLLVSDKHGRHDNGMDNNGLVNLGRTCLFAHRGPACVASGAGELHLEICLKDLQDDFMGGAEVRQSDCVYLASWQA
jgi:hypothetical protein